MKEIPFYFGNPSRQLFGVFHYPDGTEKTTAFVFCHPFAEEKLWAHRVYVNLARQLSNLGYAVLRFDFTGHGDSMGEFSDGTIEKSLEDIDKAIETIISQSDNVTSIVLFGLRFGGTLAALSAEKNIKVSALVMWHPITDGERYFQEILRSNLSTQMAVFGKIKYNRKELISQLQSGTSIDVDGYVLTGDTYHQFSQIKLTDRELKRKIPALILQFSTNEGVPFNQDFQSLAAQYSPNILRIVMEDPFWKEIRRWYASASIAQETTTNWLEKHCA